MTHFTPKSLCLTTKPSTAHHQLSYVMGVLSDIGRLHDVNCQNGKIKTIDDINIVLSHVASQMAHVNTVLHDVYNEMMCSQKSIENMEQQLNAFVQLAEEPLSHQSSSTFGDLMIALMLVPDYQEFIRSLSWDILDALGLGEGFHISLPPCHVSTSLYLQAFLTYREFPIYSGSSRTFGELMVQMAGTNMAYRHEVLTTLADDVLNSLYKKSD